MGLNAREHADAMQDYIRQGTERALALPNRGPIVLDDAGHLDPAIVEALTEMFAAANTIEFVTVGSPYTGAAGAISDDRTIGFADVNLDREVSQ